ncbi:MAG: AAA family ATPase [Boseongicola sp. SB0675_bin_26]|nr:AAA family ATPase [Boseongicola sp. SB0675_bin_26]
MKEAALEYARQGYVIFPVHSATTIEERIERKIATGKLDPADADERRGKLAKVPLVKGWHNLDTPDPAQVDKWWTQWPDAKIGMSPGANKMAVLDLDVDADKGFTYCRERLDRLNLPDTCLVVTTPRGGEHRYYALPEGVKVKSCNNFMGTKEDPSHIDLKSTGGFVLLPPSLGKGGNGAYRGNVIEGSKDLPLVSKELLEIAERTRDKDAPKAEWLIEPDLPESDADSIEWLSKKARHGTSGVDGNSTLAATGAAMLSWGISRDRAMELMLEHWNPLLDEPWSEEELRLHGGSGYDSAVRNGGVPGEWTKAYKRAEKASMFSKVEGDQAGKPAEVAPLPLETWDRTEPPPRKWLVEDWIPAGRLGSLYGKGGLGKSLLALQIAAAVMHGGKPVATRDPSDKDRAEASGIAKTLQGGQRVLWLSWEDETDEFKRRWRQAYHAKAITEEYPDPAWLGLVDMRKIGGALWGPDGAGGFNWTETGKRFLSMLEGYALAVIDPLAAAFMSSEIDRSQVRAFASALDRQAEESGCAVLIVGHPPKEEERSGKSGYSGSTDWRNAVRYMMLLETSDETGIQVHDDGKERKAGALRLRLDKASYAREDRHVWLERHYVKGPPTQLAWRITSAKNAAKAYNPDKIIPECGSGTASGQGGSRKKLPLSARSDDP